MSAKSLSRGLRVVLFMALVVAMPSAGFSMSGPPDIVAQKGKPVEMKAGWPQGVLSIINDDVRTQGFHPWFSECPNDANYYGLDVRDADDVNRLLHKLTTLETDLVELNLDPAGGAPHVDGVGAVFALGDQGILDEWYKHLPEVEPGVRTFGLHRYDKPPLAQAPTLCLYVGHKAVDLAKLEVPLKVNITTATAVAYREEHKEAVKAIDEFIEKHQAQQKQLAAHTEWISTALRNAKSVKPGMTRAELLNVFQDDGGSLRDQRRYAFRECPLIKVTVSFKAADEPDSKHRADWSQDKIMTISKPFLESSSGD